MKESAHPQNAPEPDLIDRIANALPAEVRADYYRELRHCRSLPENDEMLRILRAMLFLTLLMDQVPNRVVAERERLEQLFTNELQVLHQTFVASKTHQEQLDHRLVQLPEEIAKGISPEAIAGCINESLRQQFAISTIPETAKALAAVSADMKKNVAEFGQRAGSLGDTYHGAAVAARRAIKDIESAISRAADSATRAANELSYNFHGAYRWALYGLSSLALIVGIALGMLFQQLLNAPEIHGGKTDAPVVQPTAKVNKPGGQPKSKR